MTSYFFDLDGTLCDSRPGLVHSFQAACHALEVTVDDPRQLDRFLGTPLPEAFRQMRPGIGAKAIDQAIAAFRSAFEAQGLYQTPLYDGAAALLAGLHASGSPVWLVTLKPQAYAEIILDHLGIAAWFSGIVGAGMDETDTKTGLIARALGEAGAKAADTIMLGDRAADIIGALDNGVHPVGALWGYGPRAELAGAGCAHFAETPRAFGRDVARLTGA